MRILTLLAFLTFCVAAVAQKGKAPDKKPDKKKNGGEKVTSQKTESGKKEKKRKRRVVLYLRNGARFEGEPVGKEGKFYVLKFEKARLRVPENLVKQVVEMREERRFVVMAFESEADAEWAARQLRMNAPPSHVARIESLHPSIATDAVVDFVPRSALPEKLAEVVFSADVRKVPDPFQMDGFWWVVRVEQTRWAEPKQEETSKRPQKEPPHEPKKENGRKKEPEKRGEAPQKGRKIEALRLGEFSVIGGGLKGKDAANFVRQLVAASLSAIGIKTTSKQDSPLLRGEVGYRVLGRMELFSIKLWVEQTEKTEDGKEKKTVLAETKRQTVQGRDNVSAVVKRLVEEVVGGIGRK